MKKIFITLFAVLLSCMFVPAFGQIVTSLEETSDADTAAVSYFSNLCVYTTDDGFVLGTPEQAKAYEAGLREDASRAELLEYLESQGKPTVDTVYVVQVVHDTVYVNVPYYDGPEMAKGPGITKVGISRDNIRKGHSPISFGIQAGIGIGWADDPRYGYFGVNSIPMINRYIGIGFQYTLIEFPLFR